MATYKTEQKKALIDFLTKNSRRTFTIEEICREMEADPEYVLPPGRSTVYRLIPKLIEDNVVKRFYRGTSRKTVYQIVGGEDCTGHMHLKCTTCGRIFHMSTGISQELSKKIAEWDDFMVDAGQTMIFGICKECMKGEQI